LVDNKRLAGLFKSKEEVKEYQTIPVREMNKNQNVGRDGEVIVYKSSEIEIFRKKRNTESDGPYTSTSIHNNLATNMFSTPEKVILMETIVSGISQTKHLIPPLKET